MLNTCCSVRTKEFLSFGKIYFICLSMALILFKYGNVQEFSEKTTMHGFSELYNAKSKFWHVVWFLLIGVAIGLTCFQVTNLLKQILDGSTTTVIEPLSDEPNYPPIKICYPGFMYVVNWTRAVELGFNRSTLFYGMTFITGVISTNSFDINQTGKDFFRLMKSLNITKSLDLYKAIAYKSPRGFQNDPLMFGQPWNVMIEPTSGNNPTLFCYIATNEMIQKVLSPTSTTNTISLSFNFDLTNLDKQFINLQEQVAYTMMYFTILTNVSLPQNASALFKLYKAVPRMFLDNSRINFIIPSSTTLQADVKLSGTLYKWLKSKKRQCTDDVMNKKDYCDKYCFWKEMRKNYPNQCINIDEAMLFNTDVIDKLCTFDLNFLINGSVHSVKGNQLPTYTNPPYSISYNACITENCITPCNEWKFDSSVSVVPIPQELQSLPFPTTFYIEYPTENNILVIEEVQAQTWDTFIGNVGGIAGLWLGASIMSLFQLLYLCCCTNCDEKLSTRWKTKPK